MDNLSEKFTKTLSKDDINSVLLHFNNYIQETKENSKTYPKDMKEMSEHIVANYQNHVEKEILLICQSENPRFNLRKKIVHSSYSLAHLGVFFTKEADLNIPYTSKDMKQYMPLLFKNEPNLIHFTKILNKSHKNLSLSEIEYIFTYSFLRANFILGAYNELRIFFQDNNENLAEDWYISMIFSMYIAVEHNYRKQLNLPSLIKGENSDMEQTFFFLWFKIFDMLDISNPKEFWNEQWKKHLNKNPPF